jgi:hypothetical protein
MEVGECTVCHDHHKIRHPTPELFHGPSEPQLAGGEITSRDPFQAAIGDLPAGHKATAAWHVAIAPHVAPEDTGLVHHVEISAAGMPPLLLEATIRPGESPDASSKIEARTPTLSASLSMESVSGTPVQAGDAILLRLEIEGAGAGATGIKIRDIAGRSIAPIQGSVCRTCHEKGDKCDVATEKIYKDLLSLDRDQRGAAAILREAEIAGMEVSRPLFDLKSKGTSAAVESRALIHSFEPSRVGERVSEGRKIAAGALDEGHRALDEIQYRRKGLAVSAGLAGMVLIALALKIRQVSSRREEESENL